MKWIGLVIAVFIAAVAAFMVLKLSGKKEPAPKMIASSAQIEVRPHTEPQIETVDVYVAANFIPIGTVIEEGMLDSQPWPKHLLLKEFVVGAEKGQKLKGMVTRAPFQPREPIIMSKVVNPDDPNFLAGNLPKGKRIATIKTSEVDGVAGFVFPGDHVDLLVTHKILKEGVDPDDMEENGRVKKDLLEDVTETLLGNVRVLAVDQRSTGGVNKDGGVIIPRSVSLELSPEDAQRLKLATEIGQVSLALRSIQDKDTIETVALTRPSDLSQFTLSPTAPKKHSEKFMPVVIVRGSEAEGKDAALKLGEARLARKAQN